MPRRPSFRAALAGLLTLGVAGFGASPPVAAAEEEGDPLVVHLDTISPELPRDGDVVITGTVTNASDETYTRVNLHAFSSASPILDSATLARVVHSLDDPIKLAKTVRFCSASMGYAVFPHDGLDSRDLLKNADLTLYHAKSMGRGNLSRFTPDLRAAINRRVEMQEQALEALKRELGAG